MLLVSEMVLFLGLITPLPFKVRRKMFTFMYDFHDLPISEAIRSQILQ